MGHSDHFLSDFYEVCYPNSNFIKNHMGSPCDLPGYDHKNSQRHYFQHNSFYVPTYPSTTTHRPLSHTNNVWPSHSHFNGVLDSPPHPINVTLPSQAPPTLPASPSFWADELPLTDSDALFIPNDDGHGTYSERKEDLLSPLNGFRLRDLPHNGPQASVGPQGVKERFRQTSNPSFSPPEIPSSPDSPAAPPYLSLLGEPWMASPASVTTDTDDESSLASSISLSPDVFDLDRFIGEISIEDEDNQNFYSSPSASPGSDTDYHSLEQYPLPTSPHPGHDELFVPAVQLDDDDLSPLTISPPGLAPLGLLSLPELDCHPSPLIINSHDYYTFHYDPSTPVPSSPSLRRPATLPELEPTTFNTDSFGLQKSLLTEAPTSFARPPSPGVNTVLPDIHLRSLPGCETDDDLIPLELASKNYIPDPSAIVPTTSTGIRSLLLWDHNNNPDRSDIPTPRSPSPENFYLDPAVLAECADEEMQKVYELRQRTAKSEKWERERCRELSALLRLKLDERGVLGGGAGCRKHQSGSRSIPCCSDSSCSSSPSSSDSFTVHQPQPKSHSSFSLSPSTLPSSSTPTTSSSPFSFLPSTWSKPQTQSEGPKHQIKSMAQLVASMLFHRQSDVLRPHLSKKSSRFEPTTTSSHSHPHLSSSIGGAGMLPTPRSRLSKVTLPEELEEVDSEEEVEEAQSADGHERNEDVNVNLDRRPLNRSCIDMDLDENGNRISHTVTGTAPLCAHVSTQ